MPGYVPGVVEVRSAVVEDAAELVRLRAVMMYAVRPADPEENPHWRELALRRLESNLAEPDGTFAAFVVDKPDRPGELAACVMGFVDRRLAGPLNPSGYVGHVGNVATDPGYRRRGYSRACMETLLDWFEGRGITQVNLHASREGEPLYTQLGFARNRDPAMRLRLAGATSGLLPGTAPGGQRTGRG